MNFKYLHELGYFTIYNISVDFQMIDVKIGWNDDVAQTASEKNAGIVASLIPNQKNFVHVP